MRLDQYLFINGYFDSREKAKQAIEAGLVKVNNILVKKPSKKIINNLEISINDEEKTFVSRSANKLKVAIERFKISVKDKICLDIGSSTGGFTEYLLDQGAKLVYSVDVGENQMHPKISSNKKVKLFEKTDIRNFILNEQLDLIVVDVSFISIRKIIDKIKSLSSKKTDVLVLYKPQFEVGKEFLKKGISKHPNIEILIENLINEESLNLEKFIKVPLKGKMGNQEYFLWLKNFTN